MISTFMRLSGVFFACHDVFWFYECYQCVLSKGLDFFDIAPYRIMMILWYIICRVSLTQV